MDALLQSRPWAECVELARDFAIRDVADTQRLTGLEPPHRELWYCVATADQLEARRLWAMDKTITTRRDGDGNCEACGKPFPYYLIHNGFSDSAYAYCDTCGYTALLGLYTHPKGLSFQPFKRIDASVEAHLKPCRCGGHFTADASPRCPACGKALSAEEAASWIEANAQGSAKGWRWQRNWRELYCIVIQGRSVSDPWK